MAGSPKTTLAYDQLSSSPQINGSLQAGKAAFKLWLITLRAPTCVSQKYLKWWPALLGTRREASLRSSATTLGTTATGGIGREGFKALSCPGDCGKP